MCCDRCCLIDYLIYCSHDHHTNNIIPLTVDCSDCYMYIYNYSTLTYGQSKISDARVF